jgi:hypothetical protein
MWDNRGKKKNPKAPDFKCKNKSCDGVIWPPKGKNRDDYDQRPPDERDEKSSFQRAKNAMQSASDTENNGDGLTDTRRHLMQVANLYSLCVKAVDAAIAPNVPAALQTSEWLQAAVASLFIESSGRRTTDGVHWWSYVDKMPSHPLSRNA